MDYRFHGKAFRFLNVALLSLIIFCQNVLDGFKAIPIHGLRLGTFP
jgi:hypothetical protein